MPPQNVLQECQARVSKNVLPFVFVYMRRVRVFPRQRGLLGFLLQVYEELRVCVCKLGCYCRCRVPLLCALGSFCAGCCCCVRLGVLAPLLLVLPERPERSFSYCWRNSLDSVSYWASYFKYRKSCVSLGAGAAAGCCSCVRLGPLLCAGAVVGPAGKVFLLSGLCWHIYFPRSRELLGSYFKYSKSCMCLSLGAGALAAAGHLGCWRRCRVPLLFALLQVAAAVWAWELGAWVLLPLQGAAAVCACYEA